jgi:hypothetical protein
MSTPARRRNRFIFLIASREVPALLDRCEEEDVECLIDLRVPRPGEERDIGALDIGAASRSIYYVHMPDLAVEATRAGDEISRAQAWAARTALRHRTCLVIRGRADERAIAAEIADLVGVRLIDLDQPTSAAGTRADVDESSTAR